MFNLSKEEHAALPEGMQSKYKASGDAFTLADFAGMPPEYVTAESVGNLRRAHDRNKTSLSEATAARDDLQAQLDKISGDSARKTGDIALLEKGWDKKYKDQAEDFNSKLAVKDKFIEKALVDQVAQKLANEISLAPEVILPHIKQRLRADFDGETPKTMILDAEGNPSVMNISDLSKEFNNNAAFSSIIKGSNATGGGAAGTKDGSGGAKSLKDMTATEEAKFGNENPELYKQMLEADGKI